ncbi:type VII secretion-associated serine protease mycosin [Mycobacterium sp. Marseille-P9652]|uniref:type VII secretion-associated serine protease mycosin n=1 Tax=Mycobacterium sp. Marseille-P9652 TaxID=2654950 RepID=UPI0012E7EFDA|nr:type VII secretion-associated serine protease mycosin [Mycobacterium sp. Marseille-P9652]
MTATRAVRLVIVTAVAALSQCTTPVAQAVSPPAIDDRWLPRPAAPAPPWPTVQREACAPLPADAPPAGNGVAGSPDLSRAWQLTRGAGQRVAVIDTGVARHRGLPDVVAGGDFVSTGDGTQDCDAHGTLVAGVIAATAPDATVLSIRQSSARFAPASDPSHTGVGDVDTLAKAVRTAADLGASVINISTVACAAAGLDDRALGAALAYAVDVKNAVVVAPAGNTAGNAGGSAPCPPQRPGATWDTVTVAVSPAWYDDYVLTVGSVGADGTPSAFTLAGPWVDVAAPGEGVTPLGSPPVSGTSYAAPVVSGLAALIRARLPALTARQVIRRIESTAHRATTGRDPLVGHGTVDAVAAVSTGSPPPAATSTPAPVPITTPAPPGPRGPGSRRVALRGAGVCLLVLLACSGARRLRRHPAGVARD